MPLGLLMQFHSPIQICGISNDGGDYYLNFPLFLDLFVQACFIFLH